MPAAGTEVQSLLHMTTMESVLAPGRLDLHSLTLSRQPSIICMSSSLQVASFKLPLLVSSGALALSTSILLHRTGNLQTLQAHPGWSHSLSNEIGRPWQGNHTTCFWQNLRTSSSRSTGRSHRCMLPGQSVQRLQ